MKKTILTICFVILGTQAILANATCFIAIEKGKPLVKEGQCTTRHNPGCDFSIPVSLMGFDSGVLQNENAPQWDYKEGYETFLNMWKKPQTPRTWIVNSCVWYTGTIVEKLGYEKIKKYIEAFDYGNKDVRGMDRHEWPGELLISPEEQVSFLQKVVDRTLPISSKAFDMTEKILFIQDLPGGWKLYGKTGVGEGEGEGEKRTGWFVGWIAKGERRIPFASNVVHLQKSTSIPSFKARSNAIQKLFWLINDLEE